jgi:hypothetical protein
MNLNLEEIKEQVKKRTPEQHHQLVDDIYALVGEFRRGKVYGIRAVAGLINTKFKK